MAAFTAAAPDPKKKYVAPSATGVRQRDPFSDARPLRTEAIVSRVDICSLGTGRSAVEFTHPVPGSPQIQPSRPEELVVHSQTDIWLHVVGCSPGSK